MARLRKTNGQWRRTTIGDFGMQSCPSCGRFYPKPSPGFDENGFAIPAPSSSPCPHCDYDPVKAPSEDDPQV